MNDATELRSLAQKCRRLAKAIKDGPARDNLIGLASEYEHRADVDVTQPANDDPLFHWQSRTGFGTR